MRRCLAQILFVAAALFSIACSGPGQSETESPPGLATATAVASEQTPVPGATRPSGTVVAIGEVATILGGGPSITLAEGTTRSIDFCGAVDDLAAASDVEAIETARTYAGPIFLVAELESRLRGILPVRYVSGTGLGARLAYVLRRDTPVAYQVGSRRGDGGFRLIGVDLNRCPVTILVPRTREAAGTTALFPPERVALGARTAIALRAEGPDERAAENVLLWTNDATLWAVFAANDDYSMDQVIELTTVGTRQWNPGSQDWDTTDP